MLWSLFQLLSEVNAIATLANGNIVWPPGMFSGLHPRVQVQHMCNVHIEVSVGDYVKQPPARQPQVASSYFWCVY